MDTTTTIYFILKHPTNTCSSSATSSPIAIIHFANDGCFTYEINATRQAERIVGVAVVVVVVVAAAVAIVVLISSPSGMTR